MNTKSTFPQAILKQNNQHSIQDMQKPPVKCQT